jgi:hypothetical protein
VSGVEVTIDEQAAVLYNEQTLLLLLIDDLNTAMIQLGSAEHVAMQSARFDPGLFGKLSFEEGPVVVDALLTSIPLKFL